MTIELDEHLPAGKYVKKWEKEISGSEANIHLKVLLDSKWESNEKTNLQRILHEHKLPIGCIRDKTDWGWKVIYSGSSEDIEDYKLTYKCSFGDKEILVLEVKKGSLEKVTALMDVVKEYMDYRKN